MPWRHRFLVSAAALACANSFSLADTATWNRTGGGSWSDPASWSGGLPDSAGDTAIFSNERPTGAADIDITTATTVGSIFFLTDEQITVRGPGQLTLDGGSSGVAHLVIGANTSINAFGSTITAPLHLATDVRLQGAAVGQLALGGSISGSGDLIFESGQSTLSNNSSTYTGDVRLDGGLLRVTAPGAFGSASGITRVASAHAAVDVRFDASESFDLNNASGFAYGGAILARGGDNIYSVTGNVSLGATGSYLGGNRGLSLNADITGGGLTKVGTGLLRFTQNTVSYTGPTHVGLNGTGGTLEVHTNARLATSSEVIVNSGGVFTLNNVFQSQSDRLADSIPVSLEGGRLQYHGSTSGASTEVIDAVTLANGFSSVEAKSHSEAGPVLTLSGISREAGAVLQFAHGDSGSLGGTAASDPRIKLASAPTLTNGIVGGWAFATVSPFVFDFASYDSTRGFHVLKGARAAEIEGASSSDNVLISAAAPNALTQDRTINSVRFARNVVVNDLLDLGGHQLTIATGGLVKSFNGGLTIQNGDLTAGSTSGGELFATMDGGVSTINANVTDNAAGAVTLVKSGAGTLNLGGTNTYTGGTVVNGSATSVNAAAGRGLLAVNSASAIPSDSDLTINNGEYRINFSPASPVDYGTITLRHNGVIGMSSNAAINADSYEVESGFILPQLTGNGPMTKSTAGTVELRDNPSYSGPIHVRHGILVAANLNSLGTGQTIVHEGGRLIVGAAVVAGDVHLAGGDMAPASTSTNDTRTFTGSLHVSGHSSILTFDGLKTDSVEASDLKVTLNGPVTIAADSTLELKGQRVASLLGDVDLGGNARILASSDLLLIKPGNGRTLSGSGELKAKVQITSGALISPGHSAGSLLIDGSYEQTSAGSALFEIGGLAAGTQFDQMTVMGSGSLAGTLDIELIDGFVPDEGDVFEILAGNSISGQFTTVTGHAINDNLRFEVDYSPSGVTLTAVPEPGTLSLLASAVLPLVMRRRRSSS